MGLKYTYGRWQLKVLPHTETHNENSIERRRTKSVAGIKGV